MPVSRTPRGRRASVQAEPGSAHPIGTPTKGLPPNTGPLATAAWLVARGLVPREPRWYVEVLLGTSPEPPDEEAPTLLRVELFSEEWGFFIRHDDKQSWIRVTDLPFVHGRDDHAVLAETPALRRFGSLVRTIEHRLGVAFVIDAAAIRTSLFGAEPAIRDWLRSW